MKKARRSKANLDEKWLHKAYLDWWRNRSPAELQLQGQAFDYEERFFQDVRLELSRIKNRLCKVQVEGVNGEWVEMYNDPQDQAGISLYNWIFRYRRFRDGTLGFCESKRKTISIRPDLDKVQSRSTLLHEMIHAFEAELSPGYREWLLLDLYKRMCKRLGKRRVERYIDASTHTVLHNTAHTVFFLLKSLDLDCRCQWKPGHVFGYSRLKYFA